jgi:hypothetical protein
MFVKIPVFLLLCIALSFASTPEWSDSLPNHTLTPGSVDKKTTLNDGPIFERVSMSAFHPVDSEEPFKTAKEAENDFLLLMKAQCICVSSMKTLSIADIAQRR